MRKAGLLVMLVVAGALMVAAAACGGGDNGGTATATGAAGSNTQAPTKTGVVQIGAITSLSGRFGYIGPDFRDGAAYAVKQINDAGGFQVGDTKYTFNLTVVDDKSDQATSVQGATQLISDNQVVAIFGPIGPLGPSVADLAKAGGILNFSSSSSVGAIAGPPDYPLVFTTNASADSRVAASVQSIVQFAPNTKTVAILGPDDQTAAALVPLMHTQFQAKGITVTDFLYPTGTTDLSTVETRLAAAKPDVIVLGWAATDRQTEATQFDAAGISKQAMLFLYADTIGTCNTIRGGRPCIAHPLAGADLTSTNLTADRQKFITDYLAFTKTSALSPVGYPAILWTYDFPFMLSQAMQKAGTVSDTKAIADALRGGGITRDGLLGLITFTAKNTSVFGFDVSLVAADGTITTKHFD